MNVHLFGYVGRRFASQAELFFVWQSYAADMLFDHTRTFCLRTIWGVNPQGFYLLHYTTTLSLTHLKCVK